ncbi:hypothetical protein P7C70_g5437, partial [Phenoliferia sp. Uapishka_3]
MFEAYVGGLHAELGLEDTRIWVDQIFTPLVEAAYKALTVPTPEEAPPIPALDLSTVKAPIVQPSKKSAAVAIKKNVKLNLKPPTTPPPTGRIPVAPPSTSLKSTSPPYQSEASGTDRGEEIEDSSMRMLESLRKEIVQQLTGDLLRAYQLGVRSCGNGRSP